MKIKKRPEVKTAHITLRVRPEVKRRMEILAKRYNRSVSYVANEILEAAIKKKLK